MKKYIALFISGLSLAAAFVSCDKYDNLKAEQEVLRGLSYIKVIDIAPNFRQVFNAPDTFNVFIDQQKLSGAIITYNGGFPVLTSNTNTYASVQPGDHKIRLTLNQANTGTDPVSILEIPRTLANNQKYTLLVTDSIIRNSNYDNIWLTDNFTIPDYGKYSLRFVNALMNDTAGKSVDIYSKRYATKIFTNVPKKGVVDFTTFNYTTQSDTLFVIRSGTNDTLSRLNGASFSNKRVYTLIYKGNTTLASSVVKGKNLLTYTNY